MRCGVTEDEDGEYGEDGEARTKADSSRKSKGTKGKGTATSKAKGTKRKRKRARDPNAPKKALSAYTLWQGQARATLKRTTSRSSTSNSREMGVQQREVGQLVQVLVRCKG